MSLVFDLRASIPPCIAGCNVFTLPSKISGCLVYSESSIISIPEFLSSRDVPPVEIIVHPKSTRDFAKGTKDSLFQTLSIARGLFIVMGWTVILERFLSLLCIF